MTDQQRPWRHVSRLRLRNMVQAATNLWQEALRKGNFDRAREIRIELDEVNRELDARKVNRP